MRKTGPGNWLQIRFPNVVSFFGVIQRADVVRVTCARVI
jgi:hypothetical protein